MSDTIPQKDENIVIRTMKGDLEKLSGAPPKIEKKTEAESIFPVFPISKEAQAPIAQTPITKTPPPAPLPMPPAPTVPTKPKIEQKPPVLIIPKKTIPTKEIAEIPAKPLFKATPVWLKISGIGLGIFLLVLISLYSYWKIFIQSQPPVLPSQKIATTTLPVFPTTPVATTAPIRFFNKLPNKEVTIDISSKTSDVLAKAVKSEATVKEALASVKQIKITYQGKPITTEEFFNLMSIFAPQDFLSNYQDEFAFAFFSQKEGVRPILVLKAKDKSLAENQMKSWEASALPSDILPLFLSNFTLRKNLSAFKSYLFIGQLVRYLNINLPFASLNYAIYNDSLVFTTSSAGMFVVLQDLTGQNVSVKYLKSLEASINEFIK